MTEFHKDNGWDSLVDIGGGTVTAVLTTDIITLAIYHPWPGDITLVLSTQKDNIMTQVWIQLSVQIGLLAVTVDLTADIITLLHDIQLHVIIVKDIDCRAIKYWTWLIICMCSHSHFMLLNFVSGREWLWCDTVCGQHIVYNYYCKQWPAELWETYLWLSPCCPRCSVR